MTEFFTGTVTLKLHCLTGLSAKYGMLCSQMVCKGSGNVWNRSVTLATRMDLEFERKAFFLDR